MADSNILQKIPHRPPFLWVDRIVAKSESEIETEKYISKDLDIFKGHYPEYPILPGVILCEALFQTGALLIADLATEKADSTSGVPVVTRINKAKFKREVLPGKSINMKVNLIEQVGPAWFLKGKVLVEGKVAVTLEFACTIKKDSKIQATLK
jgi:3-hydroxyacyl-[acyl-carrier-protein] dehydratase